MTPQADPGSHLHGESNWPLFTPRMTISARLTFWVSLETH